jgi:hypothetical protein
MTALAMDRSVDPAERVRKAIEAVATGSASAVDLLAQEDFDQRVSHRGGVASKRVDVLVGQLACLVAEQLSASRDRDRFRNEIVFNQIVHLDVVVVCGHRRVRVGPARTITQLPVFGSIEAPVKAEAGTAAGRASARRLDGNESEPTIHRVMVRVA